MQHSSIWDRDIASFSPDNAAKTIPTAVFLRKMNNIFLI
jgi:hypothetical protein